MIYIQVLEPSLSLWQKMPKKVIGVESVPDAIEAAKENAERNQIENVEFFVGDMKKVFNEQFIATHGIPDVIITDPPRDGMHADVVKQILNIAPQKVVYVSCNSATQARDLALLDEILQSNESTTCRYVSADASR